MKNVPRDPSWCARCLFEKAPCEDHRDENGASRNYTGRHEYDPSPWVLSVVGQSYRGYDGKTYTCRGYDPRSGFLMTATDGSRTTSISEAAIGRTFRPSR